MGTERVEIQRIPPEIEKPFRKALGHAIRNEIDALNETLLALTDDQVAVCLSLCVFTAGFVAIDVCDREWPNEENRRGLAQATTEADHARAFGLTQQESYDYLVRVVLGSETLDSVFPSAGHSNHNAVTLSFVITGQLLLSFRPAEINWWDYLSIAENVYEVSESADLAILPGLMLRSRKLGSPRVFGEIKQR